MYNKTSKILNCLKLRNGNSAILLYSFTNIRILNYLKVDNLNFKR